MFVISLTGNEFMVCICNVICLSSHWHGMNLWTVRWQTYDITDAYHEFIPSQWDDKHDNTDIYHELIPGGSVRWQTYDITDIYHEFIPRQWYDITDIYHECIPHQWDDITDIYHELIPCQWDDKHMGELIHGIYM
jgi:hypothetical protein